MWWCGSRSSDPVEDPRILAEDLLDQRLRQVFALTNRSDQLGLVGGVVVAEIGPDDQVVLADVPREIGNVLVGLARDEHAVLAEEVRAVHSAWQSAAAL